MFKRQKSFSQNRMFNICLFLKSEERSTGSKEPMEIHTSNVKLLPHIIKQPVFFFVFFRQTNYKNSGPQWQQKNKFQWKLYYIKMFTQKFLSKPPMHWQFHKWKPLYDKDILTTKFWQNSKKTIMTYSKCYGQ